MSRVLILGAGASRGILCEKAPTSAEFGEYVHHHIKDWQVEFPYLKSSIEFFRKRIPDTYLIHWSLNTIWGAIDNRVKLMSILPLQIPEAPCQHPDNKNIYRYRWHLNGSKQMQDHFGPAGFELRNLVTRVYGKELKAEISKAVHNGSSLRKELDKLENGDCIISFNYDLLVEKMLGEGRYFIPEPEKSIPDNSILLCKPHGSVSWKLYYPECGRKSEILSEPLCDQENDYYPDKNVEIQTGIIEPVPHKSRLINPEKHSFNCLLAEQWRTLIDKISKAEEITIMGYAFPIEDEHAQYMFAEAAARRTDGKLRIKVYQLDFKSYQNVCKNLIGVFGLNASINVEYMGKVQR
jgi:hypothetical protein